MSPGAARAAVIALALLAGAALALAGAVAAAIRGSALAVPLVAGVERPQLVLAQRAIERSWGASDDSVYVAVDVPGWRSEGLAAVLSAAVPGAGQVYGGERRGLWFALIEALGWTANRVYLHQAHTERDHSVAFAGDPADSASAWSFERWSATTGMDTGQLEAVWASDRQAFYELIGRDAVYLSGWSGEAADTRGVFLDLRERAETQYGRARLAGYALWLNHALAAVDALRAARLHNLALRDDLELRLRSSWDGGRPSVVAALVRRF